MNVFESLGGLFHKTGSFVVGSLVAVASLAMLASPASAQQTTSQSTSNQLNQLFLAETTNNKSAAGEAYVSGQFEFLAFKHSHSLGRFALQGQYSFTDQLAVGGIIPLENADFARSSFGFGDVTFYGQYKLDQLVNHDVVDLTAQLDVVLPTGSFEKLRDTGRFGVRPAILAYKDFGQLGPGEIAAYASLGFTITTHCDFRMDLAGTYEWQKIVGILEFADECGDKEGPSSPPEVEIIPGVAYRGLGPLEVALGFPFGLNDDSPDWGVVLKATWAFQK